MALHRANAAPVPPSRNGPILGLRSATSGVAGALLAFSLPALPAPWLAWCVLASAIASLACARARPLAVFALALAWTGLQGNAAMQARWPIDGTGADLTLEVTITGLPRVEAASTRFDAIVSGDAALAGKRLRLSWYRTAPALMPGERWSLSLRLRRPRGTVNPGGFDAERHALERGLAATGYVREDAGNRRLAAGQGVDALRARLSAAIAAGFASPREARFVQALALGDTRALDERDWQVLRATGVAHLIAISGLHVGLVAGFGALLARVAWRAAPTLGLRLPLPQGAALCALCAAAAYTALAGFALPTVRTLLMIAAGLLAVALRRPVDATQAFALATLAVLAFDPLALLGAGFWLSYVGVAWLLWCLPRERATAGWRGLLSAQGVMTVGLLPLGAWFFGQASIAGPLANLAAVPWVSFVVVPATLFGVAGELCVEGGGQAWFAAAAWLMEVLWDPLQRVASSPWAIAWLPEPSVVALALALAGAGWCLLPRGVPGKPLAALLFLPLLAPARDAPLHAEAEIVVLDVGQGLSVLVRTRNHALLYDAGPAFDGGIDHGESTVVPALRALGVARLDAYIESHGDADHAGGSDAVLRALAPRRVHASDPRRGGTACSGAWTWDGVAFAFLHPPPHFPYLGNDSSCVLRVAAHGAVALLPGDIGALVESRLLREAPQALRADVLVAPHHGSGSSSSPDFVAAVAPRWVLAGTGHRNRFGLPRREVVARYRRAGAQWLETADHGAVRMRLGNEGGALQAAGRDRLRWWRED